MRWPAGLRPISAAPEPSDSHGYGYLRPAEAGRDEADDAGVGAERLGHHVGPGRTQPVLKEPVRQQIRRHRDAAGATAAELGHRRRDAGLTRRGEGQFDALPQCRRKQGRRDPQFALRAGSEVPAAASTTESSGRQPDSSNRPTTTRTNSCEGPMAAVTTVLRCPLAATCAGSVDPHVVAAGEEGRDEYGRNVVGRARSRSAGSARARRRRRCGPGGPGRRLTRSASSPIISTPSGLAGAVGDQDGDHAAPTG